MKAIKITTDNVLQIIDIDFNDYRSMQKAIGGHFEIVRTRKMRDFFNDNSIVFLCDEEGILKNLPFNFVASYLYGTFDHGHPVVGDIIFAQEAGEDLVPPERSSEMLMTLLHSFECLEVTIDE